MWGVIGFFVGMIVGFNLGAVFMAWWQEAHKNDFNNCERYDDNVLQFKRRQF